LEDARRLDEIPLPITIGLDVAGIVDALGPGVESFQLGERAFAKASPPHGRYAEHTVVRASQAAQMPRSIGSVDAAAVPKVGLTAWQALFDIAGLKEGQSVLIHSAAGGVGSFAVQFAKCKGAHVIGTASTGNAQFLRSIEADEVIDYKAQRLENVVRNVDVVLDMVGGDTFEGSWDVLKQGGFLVTTVADVPEGAAKAHKARAKRMVSQSDGRKLAKMATFIDERHIKPNVTMVLPLSAARRAQEMSEGRHTHEKIVLRVAEDPKNMS
jgi:NADPH:quinone reductase-like Zn-dependent oxidoreductase